MKKTVTIVISFLIGISVYSQNMQTADSAFARPLTDVLNDIQNRFGIQIKYDKTMTEGKVLKYADWRIKPWSAEETLRAVLFPFDYTYTIEPNGKYKIKNFEYARNNAEEGKKFLTYLETLYADKASWETRKSELQACISQTLYLNKLSDKPKVILTPKRKYDGYTVENFALEAFDGVYVCGSIYKPAKLSGKHPVMLNPNGHFGAGRYREDQQKRCAMQARMGIISASWDLFAWGESTLQFESSLHRLSAAHIIQTHNAVHILNYLLSLPQADPTRVGITGGSGGGSLTMQLAAADPRITLSIPVVMLSSHFSGGCPCESGMPVHLCANRTNNAEIAAMFAPKPQLIISDGKDWTSSVPELEFPFLERTYGFYNAQNNVENVHLQAEGHDYGFSKREAIYKFVAKHFGLDISKIQDRNGAIDESKVTVEDEILMRAFGPKGEKLPLDAIRSKEALIRLLKEKGIDI